MTIKTADNRDFVYDVGEHPKTIRESRIVKRIETPLHFVDGDTLTITYKHEGEDLRVRAVEIVLILTN